MLRVEFELSREALRQFGLSSPEQTLNATGSLWTSLTSEWLTHRVPSSDQTKSRWPVSPQWQVVRQASIAEDDWGIARMYGGKRNGSLFNLMPALVGYLASFGALTSSTSFSDLLPHLSDRLRQYASDTSTTLDERITLKRAKFGLP